LAALTGTGKLIVKSAGNNRGNPLHAQVPAAVRDSATLSVAGSAFQRVVAVDGYYPNARNLSVLVITPHGTQIGPVTKGSCNVVCNTGFPGQPTPDGDVYLENGFASSGGGDPEVYLEINVDSGQNMNGTWSIVFIPVSGPTTGAVDLWRYFN